MNIETTTQTATPFHNARCEVLGAIHQAFRENPSDGPVSTKKRWMAINAALIKARDLAGDFELTPKWWDAGVVKLEIERANRRCDRWDVLERAREYLSILGRPS